MYTYVHHLLPMAAPTVAASLHHARIDIYTPMSIYGCIYIYIYTKIHVPIYVCTKIDIYIYMHHSLLIAAPKRVVRLCHVHIHTHIQVCVYIYIYAHAYIYIHTNTHVDILIYASKRIDIDIYMYIFTIPCS